MDGVVSGELSKDRIREMQPNLSLSIAAAASLFRAEQKKMRANALKVQLPSGRKLYLIAFAFVQARIATYKPGSIMEANALADEIYGRFKGLGYISSIEWRKIFANAMGTFYSKGYMTKIDKGFYIPAEDDQAPAPKRYTFDEDGDTDEDTDGDDLEAPPESAPEEA